MGKDWTLDAILSTKKRVRKTVSLILDPEYGEAVADARQDVARLERRISSGRLEGELRVEVEAELELAREKLAEIEEDRADCVVDFVLHAISGDEYDVLVDRHPATAQQRSEANKQGQTVSWNPDTFPPALIAACLESPTLTEEDVATLWHSEKFNAAEMRQVFQAAMSACTLAYVDASD